MSDEPQSRRLRPELLSDGANYLVAILEDVFTEMRNGWILF